MQAPWRICQTCDTELAQFYRLGKPITVGVSSIFWPQLLTHFVRPRVCWPRLSLRQPCLSVCHSGLCGDLLSFFPESARELRSTWQHLAIDILRLSILAVPHPIELIIEPTNTRERDRREGPRQSYGETSCLAPFAEKSGFHIDQAHSRLDRPLDSLDFSKRILGIPATGYNGADESWLEPHSAMEAPCPHLSLCWGGAGEWMEGRRHQRDLQFT